MNLIEQIKNQISISDLLNKINIFPNKAGFILSIFKQEKTPSLKIYFDSNSFFDYSTNQGGDIIDFYKNYFQIDTKQAVRELSAMLNLSGEPYSPKQREFSPQRIYQQRKILLLPSEREFFEERAGIYEFEGKLTRQEANKFAFKDILKERKKIQSKIFEAIYSYCDSFGNDEKAMEYLTGKERGLSFDSIKRFKIFSINSVKNLIEFLRDNFSRDEIYIAGLFSKKYFLFSRHRIIIPYVEGGKIVYLRGRYFYKGDAVPSSFGKYIGLNNWSLTLSPKRFFNFDLLKNLEAFSELMICEGEFDCILANQIGFNAIAIPGVTNFPKDKISLLNCYNVSLAFDSDETGAKAMQEISSLFDKPIKIIKLKHHKDLTELINAAS